MNLQETLKTLLGLQSRNASPALRRQRLLAFDPLEERWTPAVTASTDATGSLIITGDDNANDIVVSVNAAGVVTVTDGGAAVAIGGVGPIVAALVSEISVDLAGNPNGTVDKLNLSAVSPGSGFFLTEDDGHDITVVGGAGADSIQGSPFADLINGNEGNDTILGQSGFDEITGDAGQDSLFGGEGVDLINGGDENDSIWGGGGWDALDGGNGNDVIHGDGENDNIWGGGDNDSLYGDAGDDHLYGQSGNDHLDGGAEDIQDVGDGGGQAGDTETEIEIWIP